MFDTHVKWSVLFLLWNTVMDRQNTSISFSVRKIRDNSPLWKVFNFFKNNYGLEINSKQKLILFFQKNQNFEKDFDLLFCLSICSWVRYLLSTWRHFLLRCSIFAVFWASKHRQLFKAAFNSKSNQFGKYNFTVNSREPPKIANFYDTCPVQGRLPVCPSWTCPLDPVSECIHHTKIRFRA